MSALTQWMDKHPSSYDWNGNKISEDDLYYLGIECLSSSISSGAHEINDLIILCKILGISNDSNNSLDDVIIKLLSENADKVLDYKNGNQKILGFFVGQTIKIAGKMADPKQVREKLIFHMEKE